MADIVVAPILYFSTPINSHNSKVVMGVMDFISSQGFNNGERKVEKLMVFGTKSTKLHVKCVLSKD